MSQLVSYNKKYGQDIVRMALGVPLQELVH